MSKLSLAAQLEALLFVANEPLPASRLAELTTSDATAVSAALSELSENLSTRGLRLTELDSAYQLVTAPEADSAVRRYLEAETRTDLTRAALETLAIIAYRGPVTRSQLDELRGVASETMIRNLLQRGLITEAGRSREPGKPLLYTVSHAFLRHFGLTSLSELPPLENKPQAAHEN